MNRRLALRWTLAAAALVALLALAFTGWVLRSEGGRDWLLARVVASLPAGSSLAWEKLEGRVSGPLVVHGLDYRQADGLHVQAGKLRIDHSVWPLLSRRWQVRTLAIEGLRIDLPKDDKPFAWPEWPGVLPRLEMPLTIEVASLRVHDLTLARAGQTLARLERVQTGLVLGPGRFALRRLTADGPRWHVDGALAYLPGEAFRSNADLRVRHLPESGGASTVLHLLARGDIDEFHASLDGRAPQAVTASLQLRDGRGTPQWRFALRSEGLQPARLGLGDTAAWRGQVQVAGRGGEATLSGRPERDGWPLDLEGSRVQASAHGLALAPLRVRIPQGPLQASGRLDFSTAPASLSLRLTSDGLRLVGTQAGAPPVVATGALDAEGTFQDWRLAGALQLQRGGERAQLTVRGRGSDQALALQDLQVRMPGGRLDGEARLEWAPAWATRADLRLAGFDPGYFAPDFPGALNGRLQLDARQDPEGRWSGTLQAPDLQGQLRGRPLQAQADLRWKDAAGEGELQLVLGGSHLQASGRFGTRLDLQADAQPLDLADLWPSAQGRLRGRLSLSGPRQAPEIAGDLVGQDLQWGGFTARALRLQGRLPHAPDTGRVRASARDLLVAGRRFQQASVQAEGNLDALQLQGQLTGEAGRLEVAGRARRGEAWSGRIERLRLAPTQGPGWALRAPTAWSLGDDGLQFERACLAQERGPGEACAQWTGDVASVSGHDLGIALVEPWLPAAAADYESYGLLAFDGRLARQQEAWTGRLTLRSPAGGARLRAAPDAPLLAYRDLQATLELAEGRLQATGGAQLSQGGRLALHGEGGLDPDDPVTGTLDFDLRDIGWMELLSPDLAAPQGRLQGQLQLAGTRASPQVGGQARLVDFRAELPALGVELREGQLSVAGEPGQPLAIEGSLRSGDGRLSLSGTFNPRDAGRPLQVSVTGDDVLVSDTPELEATASPRLQLGYQDGRLQVRGSVRVPRARVNLEGLERGVSPSKDVVVLDPREADARTGLVFDTEVTVQVGDDVRLRGFGLDGRLGGELAIRDQPGRVPVANGTLTLAGRYRAYGRDLRIRRARLSWVNAAYDDPVLDVLAEREFDEVTVGVQVRGSAQAPRTSVTSTPAMSTAEAVSWLLLGRPIETATGSETQRISASAMALSAGSGLLAQRLGVKLGLDAAGVVENRALGGSTLVVGKRLSPRLFVSYGVSLLGTGQVVMLKYLLKRGLSLGLESGTVETAASLDWRKEK